MTSVNLPTSTRRESDHPQLAGTLSLRIETDRGPSWFPSKKSPDSLQRVGGQVRL